MIISSAGGGALWNGDPSKMGPQRIGYSYLGLYTSSTGTVQSNVAEFWTAFDDYGAYITGAGVVDTYRTIVDISGAGWLSHLVGGCLALAGDVTFRVTIDDVVFEQLIAVAQDNQRACWGAFLDMVINTQHYGEDTNNKHDQYVYSPGAFADGIVERVANRSIPPIDYCLKYFRESLCRFESSLKVEVKGSQLFTSANAYWQRNGARYVTD